MKRPVNINQTRKSNRKDIQTMQHRPHYLLRATLILPMIALGACSFVDTVPGSERVVISHNIDNCKKLGETKVKVLSEIAGIDRSEDTMVEELNTLARNAAFEQGANTIKPIDQMSEGSRAYELYLCR